MKEDSQIGLVICSHADILCVNCMHSKPHKPHEDHYNDDENIKEFCCDGFSPCGYKEPQPMCKCKPVQ